MVQITIYGDKIPTGTEVEIASSAEIPDGWTEVSNIEKLISVTDGYYIKHSSGLVDLYLIKSYTVSATDSWSGVYYGLIPEITFPITFSSIINYQVTAKPSGTIGFWLGGYDVSSVTTTKISGFYVMRPSSKDSIPINFSVHIVGTMDSIGTTKIIKKLQK